MQNAKFSQEVALDLGFLGNVRRDWKQYELSKGDIKGMLGCAVMVFSPQVMMERFGEDIVCRQIEQTMQTKDLDIFGIMCNIMNQETGEMSRTIFLYSKKDSEFAKTFDGLVEATRMSELLQCKHEVRKAFNDSEYVYWELDNVSVSRKKYEIVFREFYS